MIPVKFIHFHRYQEYLTAFAKVCGVTIVGRKRLQIHWEFFLILFKIISDNRGRLQIYFHGLWYFDNDYFESAARIEGRVYTGILTERYLCTWFKSFFHFFFKSFFISFAYWRHWHPNVAHWRTFRSWTRPSYRMLHSNAWHRVRNLTRLESKVSSIYHSVNHFI